MESISLSQVVAEFRSAFHELVLSGHWFDNMTISRDFPKGCCDDSSLLLAAYLHDEGFPGALRISGSSGGNHGELVSHVWLKFGDQFIDITGSQFEDYDQPEILITEHDDFLSTFKIEPNPRLADYRQTSGLSGYDFSKAYKATLSRIALKRFSSHLQK